MQDGIHLACNTDSFPVLQFLCTAARTLAMCKICAIVFYIGFRALCKQEEQWLQWSLHALLSDCADILLCTEGNSPAYNKMMAEKNAVYNEEDKRVNKLQAEIDTKEEALQPAEPSKRPACLFVRTARTARATCWTRLMCLMPSCAVAATTSSRVLSQWPLTSTCAASSATTPSQRLSCMLSTSTCAACSATSWRLSWRLLTSACAASSH